MARSRLPTLLGGTFAFGDIILAVDVQSLRKVLELESRKGYTDKAVVGGLDELLKRWLAGSTSFTGNTSGPSDLPHSIADLRTAVSGVSYSALSQDKRREFVSSLLDLVTGQAREASTQRPKTTSLVERSQYVSGTKKAVTGPVVRKGKGAALVPTLDSPVTVVKGVSATLASRFQKLGVNNIRDLLYFFPRRHIDYSQKKTISQLAEGREETVLANVWDVRLVNVAGRRSTEAVIGDETGNVRVLWFNNPYVVKSLAVNSRIVVSGRVALFKGRYVFESPEWEFDEGETVHTGRLVPVYHLTQGLRPRQTRKLMKSVVEQWSTKVIDFVPDDVRTRQRLLDLPEAIRQAHFPEDLSQKDKARTRLAFDELFLLQLGVFSKKRDWQEGQPGIAVAVDADMLNRFLVSLPFKLTTAQEKALQEILDDMGSARPMSRLLQGEVGSGKTVVATAALLVAVAGGHQGAFMAPTEILAEQHFRTISELLSRAGRCLSDEGSVSSFAGIVSRPVTVALLTGELSVLTRRELRRRITAGKIDIVVGTHALIQKEVEFDRLGLAVVDEQHRFGVTQRSALRQKGVSPHVLVMTATPIPRTLALTLYGDLDLSVIDRVPAGRQSVKTKWLKPEQRDSAYGFIRRQVAEGHQAFIICPLVEESEAIQARSAVAEYERLSHEVFPDLRLGLVHGRMSAGDKDEVMRRFRARELDILVATPVVEVGIDIPNATVMLVESAERFGLSQLHQFRGRVGRGPAQSYCMLLADDPSEVGRQRLDIIEKVRDGFKLAEEDLKLRGPGEFFGTRQSGIPDLRMARLSDVALLEAARDEASMLFKRDPHFREPGNSPLAKELLRVWPQASEWS